MTVEDGHDIHAVIIENITDDIGESLDQRLPYCPVYLRVQSKPGR
jgi:hypothetical protein